LIKYLGSKRVLLPAILSLVREASPHARSVLDLFSGTSRVGHALKREGYRVIANDHNAYALTLARCYVQADAEEVLADATRLIDELNRLPGKPGYITETFCLRSRFFQPQNGERIDAIREEIARKGLGPEIEAVLLVSLMQAADRVDSTTGVQMAYLKSWAPRSFRSLELRVPEVLPRAAAGKGEAHGLDALGAAATLEADVAYIDPPYNQHSYLGNYHIWESLVRWDFPPVYGRACKREDVRTRTSPFNSRRPCLAALRDLVDALPTPHLIVSFNNEGFISREQMEELLSSRGNLRVVELDHKRYVGAQIGIYNPRGERVGQVSHVRNKEFLFIVARQPAGATGCAGAPVSREPEVPPVRLILPVGGHQHPARLESR